MVTGFRNFNKHDDQRGVQSVAKERKQDTVQANYTIEAGQKAGASGGGSNSMLSRSSMEGRGPGSPATTAGTGMVKSVERSLLLPQGPQYVAEEVLLITYPRAPQRAIGCTS